jgi:hypothetical protein
MGDFARTLRSIINGLAACLEAPDLERYALAVGIKLETEGSFMPTRPPVVNPPRTLIEGQRLDQPAFHALYEAMPPGTRAELINGVVHMPSPVGVDHGRADIRALMWLGFYVANTPGVETLANTSTALGLKSELQPDGLLRILPEFGGRTLDKTNFVHGAPELLAEVAHSSRYTDLGPKFDDYENAGVLEYIVRSIEPDEVCWFILRRGRLVATSASRERHRSSVIDDRVLEIE